VARRRPLQIAQLEGDHAQLQGRVVVVRPQRQGLLQRPQRFVVARLLDQNSGEVEAGDGLVADPRIGLPEQPQGLLVRALLVAQ
jgi:hypothetical protein